MNNTIPRTFLLKIGINSAELRPIKDNAMAGAKFAYILEVAEVLGINPETQKKESKGFTGTLYTIDNGDKHFHEQFTAPTFPDLERVVMRWYSDRMSA